MTTKSADADNRNELEQENSSMTTQSPDDDMAEKTATLLASFPVEELAPRFALAVAVFMQGLVRDHPDWDDERIHRDVDAYEAAVADRLDRLMSAMPGGQAGNA